MEPDDESSIPIIYPSKLGKFQSPVSPGFPVDGGVNSVVLIFAATQAGGLTSRQTPVFNYVSGAVLWNRRNQVVTAMHTLFVAWDEVNGGVRTSRGPMRVWAMPARDFHLLHESDKRNPRKLLQLGAIPATGYFSLAANLGPTLVDYNDIPPFMDSVVVELEGPLDMPANQPLILSAAQVANLVGWLRRDQEPRAMMEVVVEGMGYYTTTGHILDNADAALWVDWADTDDGTWTWTKTWMSIQEFRDQLSQAIVFRAEDRICPRSGFTRVGMLRIDNLFVPTGFSGGGTYIRIPAVAINPHASPNLPDVVILIGIVLSSNAYEQYSRLRFLTREWLDGHCRLRRQPFDW